MPRDNPLKQLEVWNIPEEDTLEYIGRITKGQSMNRETEDVIPHAPIPKPDLAHGK
jgi:hypothetical protein